jgi:hypothetical protein
MGSRCRQSVLEGTHIGLGHICAGLGGLRGLIILVCSIHMGIQRFDS